MSTPSGIPALLVEPDDGDRVRLTSTLSWAGLSVTATSTFRSARAVLVDRPPSVLVTELRLGAYNGLHLALLGRAITPHIAILVTSGLHDRGLQRDAEALGAIYLRKPLITGELLAALYQTARLERRDDERRHTVVRGVEERERRCARRQRDIASFLLLEALRRQRADDDSRAT